VKVTRMENNLV